MVHEKMTLKEIYRCICGIGVFNTHVANGENNVPVGVVAVVLARGCLPSWSESLGHLFFHWKFCGLRLVRSRWRRRRDKNGTGGHICKTCSRRHIDNDRGDAGWKHGVEGGLITISQILLIVLRLIICARSNASCA